MIELGSGAILRIPTDAVNDVEPCLVYGMHAALPAGTRYEPQETGVHRNGGEGTLKCFKVTVANNVQEFIGQYTYPSKHTPVAGTLDGLCRTMGSIIAKIHSPTEVSAPIAEYVQEVNSSSASIKVKSVTIEKGPCKLTVFMDPGTLLQARRGNPSIEHEIFDAINPCDAQDETKASGYASSGLKARLIDHANHRRSVSCYHSVEDSPAKEEKVATLEYPVAQSGSITDQALCNRINALAERVKAIVKRVSP
jgi:hypothetical protein